jgi:hypothetical protein
LATTTTSHCLNYGLLAQSARLHFYGVANKRIATTVIVQPSLAQSAHFLLPKQCQKDV